MDNLYREWESKSERAARCRVGLVLKIGTFRGWLVSESMLRAPAGNELVVFGEKTQATIGKDFTDGGVASHGAIELAIAPA